MALKKVSPGLSKNTSVTGKQIFYSDLDLSFSAKPGTPNESGVYRGDVYKKIDTQAVVQAVENILLTNTGEKPFLPSFGANLRQMLFDLSNSYSEQFVTEIIKSAIKRWEPRAFVLDVKYYAGEELISAGIADFRKYVNNNISIRVEMLIDNEGTVANVNMNRLR